MEKRDFLADFAEFVAYYTKARVQNGDNGFVKTWRRRIEQSGYTLEELKSAVDDLVGDPRIKYPVNDLPILLELAQEVRDSAKPKKPPALPPILPRDSLWDQKMKEWGVISPEEFNRRKKERASPVKT